jgi:hypothetical protein
MKHVASWPQLKLMWEYEEDLYQDNESEKRKERKKIEQGGMVEISW